MTDPAVRPLARRGFLLRLSSLAVALGLPGTASASTRAVRVPGDEVDAWIQALHGKHKQIFHADNARDARALAAMHAYLQGYARAYAVPEREVNAVLAAQGGTTMYLLGDGVWAKYALGAMAKVNDPRTQQPSVRNTWRAGGDGEMLSAEMAIEGLQRRGTVFLVCENSLHAFATQLSSKTDIPIETVQADLRAGLLPGVIVVPAMVIAVGRAQEHGFTYIST